jgi:MFS transporter, DHA3 family, macrolide efflux protein
MLKDVQSMKPINEQAFQNWKKKTILFLVSQTISLFGTALVQYAIMWYITLETHSGVMMTISILCGFLPTFFLSPFAGVWADRYNRKTLIMMADAMIAISTLILAIVFLLGYDAFWLLFVMSAIRACGTAVQTPAVGAFIPQIVPEDQLTRVNGINGSIQALIMIVAPITSGALLTMATIETIFMIDVITAVIAIMILIIFLHVTAHAKALENEKISYFDDLREGFLYIKHHVFLKKFFLFCAVFLVLISPSAFLTPLQVTRSFGDDVWRLTAIEIAFAVGMMAGGLLMATWGGFKNRIHTMTLSTIVIGACTVALGVVSVFWIYLVFMVLVGVTIPFFNTPSTVLLQEKIEPNLIGRVFGVYGMIATSMMPLGMLVFGPISDIIKIEWLLIGTGFLVFLQGFYLLGDKVLLEAGKPITKESTEIAE